MNWPLIAYVAFGLATAEFLHRAGVNWFGQLLAGLAWPVYWGHCFLTAWRSR